MDLENRLGAEITRLRSANNFRELKIKNDLVDFCSNDYLGLSRNTSILSKLKHISYDKMGSGGSRLLSGNSQKIEDLETLLASRHNKESALLFNSGYVANLSFFSAIPNKESVILYDEKIHACIKDGMRLSFSSKFSFSHNNLDALEKKLKNFEGKEIFVAVESVYSMDGDFAPLVDIARLCQKYGAFLVVDEAHSTGTFGAGGSGLASFLDLDGLVFAKIHTFGKAIGVHGAAIVGSVTLRNYLINKARPFIYTTAMPEHEVLALSLVYGYLEENWQEEQFQMQQRIKWFRNKLTFQIPFSESPIQVVIIPGNENVRRVSSFLENNGLDIRPVLSPTVAKGEERLRICLHNYNTKPEIEFLADLINQSL